MTAPAKGRLARLWPALGRRPRGLHLWRRDRPRVWAHRGASAHATENTLAAFELAVAHGADGIELDVLCCATGEVVVFHDDDLRRLADRPETIASMPWRELAAVELVGGQRIPRLEDALAAAGSLEVNVELKSTRPARPGPLPAAAAAAIARAGAGDRVLVSSFDPVLLWQLHLSAPHLPLAFLFGTGLPRRVPAATVGMVTGASALHPDEVLCTPASVAEWHRRGFAVNTWTVDDPARLRALAAMGVDGVFANDPRAARAVFDGAG
ncbi:MAG TPA: glycerophosphodiester phosphodiesterase [Kofleriaceae bacterium]|nr:glycerophosphodiester phosphodiesterase [Kofleriaceae bacterium]